MDHGTAAETPVAVTKSVPDYSGTGFLAGAYRVRKWIGALFPVAGIVSGLVIWGVHVQDSDPYRYVYSQIPDCVTDPSFNYHDRTPACPVTFNGKTETWTYRKAESFMDCHVAGPGMTDAFTSTGDEVCNQQWFKDGEAMFNHLVSSSPTK